MSDVIAVEHERALAERMKLLFQIIGDGRFAGARQAGEPEQRRLLRIESCARCFGDFEGLEIGVRSAAQAETDHARRDCRVAVAVDQMAPPVHYPPDEFESIRLYRCLIVRERLVAMQLLGSESASAASEALKPNNLQLSPRSRRPLRAAS